MPRRSEADQHDSHRIQIGPGRRLGAGGRAAWVTVADLDPIARALLRDGLSDTDVVPLSAATRAAEQAVGWAAAGFTPEQVRGWKHIKLPLDTCAQLATRGVDPASLSTPTQIWANAAPVPLVVAIASGVISVPLAHTLLATLGLCGRPAGPDSGRRAVPAVVFRPA
jgi:hypothetical protein